MRCTCRARTTPHKNCKTQTARKAAALVLCALLVLAFLFSAAFLSSHAGHAHDHNGPGGACATCLQLAAAGHVLKLFSAVLLAAGLAPGALRRAVFAGATVTGDGEFSTPVALKVRLNN